MAVKPIRLTSEDGIGAVAVATFAEVAAEAAAAFQMADGGLDLTPGQRACLIPIFDELNSPKLGKRDRATAAKRG